MNRPVYKRILLKISGEVLAGDQPFGIDAKIIDYIAGEIAEVAAMGVEVAIVIGGGNIFRGISADGGIERASADYMGMLATMLNALALQNALEKQGAVTRVQSAIEMHQLAEGYIRRRAIRHLEKGRIVIFAAGLRGMEIGAEVILKGTKVAGIYDDDPMKNPNAKKFDRLPFLSVLDKKLKVMDSTALSLCMDHNLPIIVFNVKEKGNIKRILQGERLGTLVRDEVGQA